MGMIGWVRDAPLAQTDETTNVVTIAATRSPYTVTIQPLGQNPQELALYVAEYAGVTALDQSASLLTPGGAASPVPFSSGVTQMTTAANEVLVSIGSSCSGNPGMVSLASTSGFTIRAQEMTTNTREPGVIGDKVVSATGTYSADWTATFTVGPSNPNMAVIATLR